MVATLTASYFLLTADYGSEPNVLDPVCVSFSLNHLSYFLIVFSLRVQLVVKNLQEKRDGNFMGDFILKKKKKKSLGFLGCWTYAILEYVSIQMEQMLLDG